LAEAGDGATAVAAATRTRPDVALMDIRMPRLDGIEATRRTLAACPGTRVIMLTTFGIDDYVYRALRAGASGFILKDLPPTDLLNAIRVVADGDALLAPAVTRQLIEEFAGRPEPRSLAVSPSGNARSSVSSPKACPTPRSPSGYTSAWARSKPTSGGCSPSSAPGTARNWSLPPTMPAWSGDGECYVVAGPRGSVSQMRTRVK
jgi:CheY-like chemotaxis protein